MRFEYPLEQRTRQLIVQIYVAVDGDKELVLYVDVVLGVENGVDVGILKSSRTFRNFFEHLATFNVTL